LAVDDRVEDPYARAADLAERGRYEEAAAILSDLVASEPEHVAALAKLGGIEARAGDLDAAQAHLEHALSLDPKWAPAWSNLGNVAYQRGDYDEAERCYRKALAISPNDPVALNNLAAVFKRRGNISAMVDALKRAHRAELRGPDRGAAASGRPDAPRQPAPARSVLGCGTAAALCALALAGLLAALLL
jgi:Flp pilus assembly protein TadD